MEQVKLQGWPVIFMLIKTIVKVLAGILMILSIAFGGVNKGEANKELSGGSRGKVPFPHRMHQETLDDCNICHSVFPQTHGSIEDLKTKGELEKKQVMNKLCIKCHKDEKKQEINRGRPHAPSAMLDHRDTKSSTSSETLRVRAKM